MNTDNKTLADVQPGGRVRLGNVRDRVMGECEQWFDTSDVDMEAATDSIIAAAQPSPGGQGDALDMDRVLSLADVHAEESREDGVRLLDRGGLLAFAQDVATVLAARQAVGEPVCSGGFVISNGSGEKYMAWGQVGPEWTADRSAALWLVRRADAEALAAENEDAWSILPVERCALPPNGWACTLAAGHEGPCPTIAAPPAQALDLVPSIPSELAPVVAALKRFNECAEDCGSGGCDIGRAWFDALTTMGLLKRTQRSPAVWTMTAEGERLLALLDSQAVGNGN
ncbi:hypothetical protein JAK74_11170 [Stenotrophomonas maltophilia]|nr:hypothetical protein [Stenotrophomonas maltophilia]